MRSIKCLIAALISTLLFTACHKEAESATITLERNALYFSSWSDSAQSISYTTTGAQSVAISSLSEGWSASVNQANQTITIWPVGAVGEGITEEDLPTEGSVVVNALNSDGKAVSGYIYVYITQTETLDKEGSELANCYIVRKPALSYTFDAMHRPDGEPLDTKRVGLLWQSNPGVVKNVNLADGKAIFYVDMTANNGTALEDTNAVIAAYNAGGEIVWSWHLWITDSDYIDRIDSAINGSSFMHLNLGAFTNSNGSTDKTEIHDSYGMYYQWGRKDPFPRPYYHDASGGDNESRYDSQGIYIAEKYYERTAERGTVEYTIKHPMEFIFNSQNSEYNGDSGNGVGDWLTTSDNTLWGEESKSVYDPCPYGWRVPTSLDYQIFALNDDKTTNLPYETALAQFGWLLSDGATYVFYPACGRRRYIDGMVENMNHSDDMITQPRPWEGHYWTASATDEGLAKSLYFDLKTPSRAETPVSQVARFRANGMQIRCVEDSPKKL